MCVLKVKVISLPYIFQVLCFTRPRYQVNVYRTIGPLVYVSCMLVIDFTVIALLKYVAQLLMVKIMLIVIKNVLCCNMKYCLENLLELPV